MDDQKLKLARPRRALRPVARPGRRIGESDRDVEPDRRIDLRLGPDARRQIEALNERSLKLPGQPVVADLDRLLQDPLDVRPSTGLINRRQAGMLFGRELLDVLSRHEHPRRDVLAGLIEMLIRARRCQPAATISDPGHACRPRNVTCQSGMLS